MSEEEIKHLSQSYYDLHEKYYKLQEKCKKQKKVIDRVSECIKDFLCSEEYIDVDGIAIANNYNDILDILNEVSK